MSIKTNFSISPHLPIFHHESPPGTLRLFFQTYFQWNFRTYSIKYYIGRDYKDQEVKVEEKSERRLLMLIFKVAAFLTVVIPLIAACFVIKNALYRKERFSYHPAHHIQQALSTLNSQGSSNPFSDFLAQVAKSVEASPLAKKIEIWEELSKRNLFLIISELKYLPSDDNKKNYENAFLHFLEMQLMELISSDSEVEDVESLKRLIQLISKVDPKYPLHEKLLSGFAKKDTFSDAFVKTWKEIFQGEHLQRFQFLEQFVIASNTFKCEGLLNPFPNFIAFLTNLAEVSISCRRIEALEEFSKINPSDIMIRLKLPCSEANKEKFREAFKLFLEKQWGIFSSVNDVESLKRLVPLILKVASQEYLLDLFAREETLPDALIETGRGIFQDETLRKNFNKLLMSKKVLSFIKEQAHNLEKKFSITDFEKLLNGVKSLPAFGSVLPADLLNQINGLLTKIIAGYQEKQTTYQEKREAYLALVRLKPRYDEVMEKMGWPKMEILDFFNEYQNPNFITFIEKFQFPERPAVTHINAAPTFFGTLTNFIKSQKFSFEDEVNLLLAIGIDLQKEAKFVIAVLEKSKIFAPHNLLDKIPEAVNIRVNNCKDKFKDAYKNFIFDWIERKSYEYMNKEGNENFLLMMHSLKTVLPEKEYKNFLGAILKNFETKFSEDKTFIPSEDFISVWKEIFGESFELIEQDSYRRIVLNIWVYIKTQKPVTDKGEFNTQKSNEFFKHMAALFPKKELKDFTWIGVSEPLKEIQDEFKELAEFIDKEVDRESLKKENLVEIEPLYDLIAEKLNLPPMKLEQRFCMHQCVLFVRGKYQDILGDNKFNLNVFKNFLNEVNSRIPEGEIQDSVGLKEIQDTFETLAELRAEAMARGEIFELTQLTDIRNRYYNPIVKKLRVVPMEIENDTSNDHIVALTFVGKR